ncbi:uncharacterized protein EDB93DRAFT_1330058 [Suillus bovinus]|uniref:uncharacterized protein n=1 Tax=Suillus bovinus TaxID=48563 RepID=UPI001B875085|nr:uncharacterized protein EDB93DRAFT_1330058 [Suillus bovinus]KAG2140950.1 hypothetical protein EDB93DRAFT_1330058 [Suillus bovinus]
MIGRATWPQINTGMVQLDDEDVVCKREVKETASIRPRRRRLSSCDSDSSSMASCVTAVICDLTNTTRYKRQLATDFEPRDKQAKRPRANKAALRKHERFWLADGNAIIELDDICFRVHQSWIMKHSKRVAAILPDRTQGDRLEEITLDFCGVLKAIDLEALLSFYENPGDYRDYIETPTLISLIRAATILGFDSDRAWLVRELEALWPSNLGELFVNPEPRLDAPEVACLARTCNIDSLLKPAFYDMARAPGFGLDRLDESEQISRSDLLRLVRMREYLSGMWAQVAAHEDPTFVCQNLRPGAAASINDEGPSSLSRNTTGKTTLCPASSAMYSHCLSATIRRKAWVRLVHYSDVFAQYRYDPLRGLAALTNIAWTDEWCKDCVKKRKSDWYKMQRKIWEVVGEYLKEE